MIASLVDKSLVTATGEAEVRYRLLETVRAYAAERLAEAGEEEQVRAAHARYFLDLAEQGEPRLRSADQLTWLARLSAEHDNFAAALRYVIGARDAQAGLRFIAALSWFWVMRDYETEAGEWAAAVRDITAGPVPPGLGDAYAICHIVSAMTAASQAEDAPPPCCWTRWARPRPWRAPIPATRCWCWPSPCWPSSAGNGIAPWRNWMRWRITGIRGCAPPAMR